MARFTFTTTAEEAASALSGQIKGKTVLITGISPGGLGAEAAKAMAVHQPALLILASRNLAKVEEVVKEIKALAPNANIRPLKLDLSSQKAVREAAEEVLAYPENIDVLLNSAAVMATPYQTTPDGVEMQFGTNHIGHFLFTNLIMSKIVAAGPGARIVNVSSRGHRFSGVRFDDVNFGDGKAYDRWQAYGAAKTANILYSVSLAEKLKSKGVYSFSLHPGMIPYSNIGQYISKDEGVNLATHTPDGKPKPDPRYKTLAQGAASEVIAAFDREIEDGNGCYLYEVSPDAPAGEDAKPYALDKENAKKLWALSEEIVGQKFEL